MPAPAPATLRAPLPPLRPSTPSYNALLAVYAVSKVLDERGRGDQLLAEMRTRGLQWDSYTYTALMMGRTDRKEVIRLWEDMVAKGGLLPTQAAAAELFKACELEVGGNKGCGCLGFVYVSRCGCGWGVGMCVCACACMFVVCCLFVVWRQSSSRRASWR